MSVKASKRQVTKPTRKETYKPPSAGELPDNLVLYFASQGYHLRFVRWQLNGVEDHKNIRDRMQEGYTPVTHKDLQGTDLADYLLAFENSSFNKYSGVICIGDLALCKIPLERVEAIKEYYEEKALEQIRPQLGEDKRLNRMAPMKDTSESRAVFGKRKLNFGESSDEDESS